MTTLAVNDSLAKRLRKAAARALPFLLCAAATGAAFATYLDNVAPGLATAAVAAVWLGSRAGGAARTLLVNLAGICLVLTAFEIYASFAYQRVQPVYDVLVRDGGGAYFRADPELGYAATGNTKVRSRLYLERTPAYDVVYTIDSRGLRAHPGGHPDSPFAILFFGCSFVFGEGVNDDETLPFQFETLDPPHRKALNFGLHGYGPHHMLALLQASRESASLGGSRPEYAVYIALSDHVRRVAGRAQWDTGGPRFVLRPDGFVTRRAAWEQHAFQDTCSLLARSKLGSHMLDLTLFRTDPMVASFSELELYVAVVVQSAHVFEQRYEGARFVVVLDDGIGGAVAWPPWFDVASALRAKGLTVLRAVDLMPASQDDPALSIARDGHPSPLANRLLARALVLRLPPSSAESLPAP